jgi:hypothetical protein
MVTFAQQKYCEILKRLQFSNETRIGTTITTKNAEKIAQK